MAIKKKFTGFFDFIRSQGVVGLAIGFILGGAVSDLVGSFVEDIIEPILGLLIGSSDGLENATFMIGEAAIGYGRFLAFLVDFIVIAAVVYFIFKGLRLDRLDKKKDSKK